MAAPTSTFPPDVTVDGKILGIRTDPGDEILASAFLRLKQEGLVPVFFHNQPGITLTEVLAWAKNTVILGCFTDPSGPDTEFHGAVFINRSMKFGEDLTVEVGEFFMRGLMPAYTEAFARLGLDFCFDYLSASVVYGITPIQNRAAILFPKKLGFEFTQPLPGMCGWGGKATSGVISFMTRARWKSLKEKGGE